MAGRFGPTDFAACARCGSNQVHPKLLVMGPIAGIDSDSRSYVCHACGHEGLPIFFDTEGARDQFEREKKGMWDPEPKAAAKGVVTIPILPIQTDPLIDIRGLDLLPGRVASVTGVRWDAGHLSPTAYRVSFQEYWDAIGGPRYNASRVFMLDLAGVNRANPNFEVTRHLVKRCDVWLESGGREPEEVMDGYMLDVERVVAGSAQPAKTRDEDGGGRPRTDAAGQSISWVGPRPWLNGSSWVLMGPGKTISGRACVDGAEEADRMSVMFDANFFIAVIVATIVSFVIGGIWYGPAFGKAWMARSGKPRRTWRRCGSGRPKGSQPGWSGRSSRRSCSGF